MLFSSSNSFSMNALRHFNCNYQSPFLSRTQQSAALQKHVMKSQASFVQRKVGVVVRACASDHQGENKADRRSFLTPEEAGLVEISGLATHERFLCRLTISSLNLLRVISEQEGCPIEELNAGKVCDWFLKDKLMREQNPGSAVLQWDDSEFQF